MRIATPAYTDVRVSVQPTAVDPATSSESRLPSGRLLLRMPPSLHAALTQAAEEDGASLNAYITTRLAASVGWVPGEPERGRTHEPTQPVGRGSLQWLLVANVAAVGVAAIGAIAILLVAWLG